MAIALEIIPESMHVEGHSTDVDYEIHIIRSRDQAKEVFDTEARKLVAPYDSEFLGWITRNSVQAICSQNLSIHSEHAPSNSGVCMSSTSCVIGGIKYRISSHKIGRRSADSNQ